MGLETNKMFVYVCKYLYVYLHIYNMFVYICHLYIDIIIYDIIIYIYVEGLQAVYSLDLFYI